MGSTDPRQPAQAKPPLPEVRRAISDLSEYADRARGLAGDLRDRLASVLRNDPTVNVTGERASGATSVQLAGEIDDVTLRVLSTVEVLDDILKRIEL
jgi:hypothetical protein